MAKRKRKADAHHGHRSVRHRRRGRIGEVNVSSAVEKMGVAGGSGYLIGMIHDMAREHMPEHGHDNLKMGAVLLVGGYLLTEASSEKNLHLAGDAAMGVGGYLLHKAHHHERHDGDGGGYEPQQLPINGPQQYIELGNPNPINVLNAGPQQGGVGAGLNVLGDPFNGGLGASPQQGGVGTRQMYVTIP